MHFVYATTEALRCAFASRFRPPATPRPRACHFAAFSHVIGERPLQSMSPFSLVVGFGVQIPHEWLWAGF